MCGRVIAMVIVFLGVINPLLSQEKKQGKNFEFLQKRFTDDELGKLIEELQDMERSRRAEMEIAIIDAPKEVVVSPSEKKPKVSLGEVVFKVKVKNISKKDLKFRPAYVGIALCEDTGKEFPIHHWLINTPHGITGVYDLKPGKDGYRPVVLRFAHEKLKPGQTYTLIASYFSTTEQIYSIHSFKTDPKKAKEQKK